MTWIMWSRSTSGPRHMTASAAGLSSRHGWTWICTSVMRVRERFVADGGRLMRMDVPRGVTALGCMLLLAACDTSPLSSPAAKRPVGAATSVSAGPFTFANFELGAEPGTVCPGPSGCTNGAAEPAIRADATGTFYVSSELGLSSGTLAWKSTDGGLHYTALESPNQLSRAAGGFGPGGGDTDLRTAPQAN